MSDNYLDQQEWYLHLKFFDIKLPQTLELSPGIHFFNENKNFYKGDMQGNLPGLPRQIDTV